MIIGESRRATDRVRLGSVGDLDSVIAISQAGYEIGIAADVIAGHSVEVGTRIADPDPGVRVCGNFVRLFGRAGVSGLDADAVGLGAIGDPDPVVAVPHGGRVGLVDADQIAGDDIRVGAGPTDVDSLIGVVGDDVSLRGIANAVAVGADHVGLGAIEDEDSHAAVAERRFAGDVGADQVAGDHVEVRAGVTDHDPGVRPRRYCPRSGCPRRRRVTSRRYR